MVELGVTVPGSALTEALNKVYEKTSKRSGVCTASGGPG